jgi:pimeloyl-ACP methyl ester carboxylesterase
MPAALHVEDSGVETGTGEAVLLLHSSGLSGRQWRRLVPELVSRGLRAIVPDLSGHGSSEPWPEPRPFSFRTDVERVALVLEDRRLDRVHVIGHSYGGFVALHVARALPHRMLSLSLFDPVAFGSLDPVADADARAILAGVDSTWGPREADRERWLAAFVGFWTDGGWPMLREDMRAEFRRVVWVVREGVRTMLADTTPYASYGAFDFPVQLISGGKSPLPARRVIDRLAAAVPQARMAVVPGVGHLAPVTHADAVNPILLGALDRPR